MYNGFRLLFLCRARLVKEKQGKQNKQTDIFFHFILLFFYIAGNAAFF